MLVTSAAGCNLVSAVNGSVRATGEPLRDAIVSPASLPPSALRDRLAGLAGQRALLAVQKVHLESHACRISDDIGKTIGNGTWTRAASAGSHTLRIAPLRGYEGEIAQLAREALDEHAAESHVEFVRAVLALGPRQPGVYSARVTLVLDSEEPIGTSLARAVGYFAAVMKENIPGILHDWDAEFLHDYRVAVRRLRSLVSEARRQLPREPVAQIRAALHSLASATGTVRDLDVLLGREASFGAILPRTLHPGLEEFFQWIRRTRQAAFGELSSRMDGEHTRAALEQLTRAARGLADLWRPNDRTRSCAAGWIRKRLRGVLAQLDSSAAGDDARLHGLRIECKKLRYLLEVFASVFDPAVVRALTDRLREFQDTLGQLNDTAVQQGMLEEMLERMQHEGEGSLRVAASLGGLITEIARHRPDLLDGFEAARQQFLRLAGQDAVRREFAAPRGGNA